MAAGHALKQNEDRYGGNRGNQKRHDNKVNRDSRIILGLFSRRCSIVHLMLIRRAHGVRLDRRSGSFFVSAEGHGRLI